VEESIAESQRLKDEDSRMLAISAVLKEELAHPGPSQMSRDIEQLKEVVVIGTAVAPIPGFEEIGLAKLAEELGVLADAKFAQLTFRETFSRGGKFAGQTIADVATALKAGKLSVADVPHRIHCSRWQDPYFEHSVSGGARARRNSEIACCQYDWQPRSRKAAV
jgi:hypothetical protein